MADYETGYGKPPKHTRFAPGRSGNPRGRPSRRPDPIGEVVQNVMDAPVRYRENGRTKTGSRTEVRLKMLLEKAVKGDVGAADTLLEERKHALKHEGSSALQLIVSDWLPDFDGQTAEQKTVGAMPPAAPASGPQGPGHGQAGDAADGQRPEGEGF